MGSTSEKALFADPAPPGLSAFAITTFLLSLAIVTNSVVAPNTLPLGPRLLKRG